MVPSTIFRLVGKINNEERLTDESGMCDTIDALLDNTNDDDKQDAHVMLFSPEIMQHPRAIQLLVRRGVPTSRRVNGRFALHVFLQSVHITQSPEVVPTISLFNDEDFATEFNGLTPLKIAMDRGFPASIIEHIKSRIEK